MSSVAEVAAQLQGYDPQALSVAGVNEFLLRLVHSIDAPQQLPLFEALGRVLAEDVISPINVPPHDNSAMDGFALRGSELRPGEPLQLSRVGTALAGVAWRGTVGPGECVKIMTGAVMPDGLDTVVPQELVKRLAQNDLRIEIPANLLKLGDNRRHLGEDLRCGEVALQKGAHLGPAALGLVASLGLARVQVQRRLKVAYFSTGDEILSLGEPLREGAVYDSNRYTLFGLLSRLGCEVFDLGVVRDEPALLEAAFTNAASHCDAIITSAMRPGRPMAVGRIGQALLFGLPGNPVAVMVTFLAFVRPALLRLMGSSALLPPLLKAYSLEPLRKKPGRTEYQRGTVSTAADGSLTVRTTGNQGSGVLSSMVQANGLIVLHHAQGDVATGEPVDVMMFDGAI